MFAQACNIYQLLKDEHAAKLETECFKNDALKLQVNECFSRVINMKDLLCVSRLKEKMASVEVKKPGK